MNSGSPSRELVHRRDAAHGDIVLTTTCRGFAELAVMTWLPTVQLWATWL
jgi:hypothetical protein